MIKRPQPWILRSKTRLRRLEEGTVAEKRTDIEEGSNTVAGSDVEARTSVQAHDPINHSPTKELQLVTTPWHYSTWGMDILGPFPMITHKVTSTKHPQVYGQAEVANKVILGELWRRRRAKGLWEELFQLHGKLVLPTDRPRPSGRSQGISLYKAGSLPAVGSPHIQFKVQPRDLGKFDLIWQRTRDIRKKKEEWKLTAN
ncbi:hypothetical protein CR513_54682, partial [Mucuna pruriens]